MLRRIRCRLRLPRKPFSGNRKRLANPAPRTAASTTPPPPPGPQEPDPSWSLPPPPPPPPNNPLPPPAPPTPPQTPSPPSTYIAYSRSQHQPSRIASIAALTSSIGGHAVDAADDALGFVMGQDRRGLGAIFGHAGAHRLLIVVGRGA